MTIVAREGHSTFFVHLPGDSCNQEIEWRGNLQAPGSGTHGNDGGRSVRNQLRGGSYSSSEKQNYT